ncbi:MAG: MipA/OmpV family protein [Sphingomonas sp.]|uniref:MipA/OmpV family protein n=1 Tax=Sphingomonas sp. TaxID=28214 RepID=UPI001B0697C1|nr:MipA/OmpV family protein [Sphingomonas sp.]MBO9624654.1 MipA/OmpV family protein [Sphingomonas sp.]
MIRSRLALAALAFPSLASLPASAQTSGDQADANEPRRYRVALGPQLVPSYPGADRHSLRPFVDVSVTRGSKPFEFEAPDESFGLSLLRSRGFEAGPALNIEGRRTREEVGADLDEVGTTVEVGGYAQYWLTPGLRFRAEARKGIGGHKGWVGNVGADLVARDGDRWLVSLGPRLTLADALYQRTFFGVNPREAAATGLPAFSPESGVNAVGATAGAIYQLSPRWGLQGYAKYDRLVSDASRSPAVRAFGSRDQFSGGLALSYTFGRGVR